MKAATQQPPVWTLLTTLLGTTAVVGWLGSLRGGGKESTATASTVDYFIQPLPDAVDAALGVLGIVTLAVTALYVFKRYLRGVIDPVWSLVFTLLAMSGAVWGTIWFSITYGTVDANIGGGIALIFFTPFAVLLLIAAAVSDYIISKHIQRRQDVAPAL